MPQIIMVVDLSGLLVAKVTTRMVLVPPAREFVCVSLASNSRRRPPSGGTKHYLVRSQPMQHCTRRTRLLPMQFRSRPCRNETVGSALAGHKVAGAARGAGEQMDNWPHINARALVTFNQLACAPWMRRKTIKLVVVLVGAGQEWPEMER